MSLSRNFCLFLIFSNLLYSSENDNKCLEKEFRIALDNNDPIKIKELIQNGFNCSKPLPSFGFGCGKFNALQLAVCFQKNEVLKSLIYYRNPNLNLNKRSTPEEEILEAVHVDEIGHLISYGFNSAFAEKKKDKKKQQKNILYHLLLAGFDHTLFYNEIQSYSFFDGCAMKLDNLLNDFEELPVLVPMIIRYRYKVFHKKLNNNSLCNDICKIIFEYSYDTEKDKNLLKIVDNEIFNKNPKEEDNIAFKPSDEQLKQYSEEKLKGTIDELEYEANDFLTLKGIQARKNLLNSSKLSCTVI